MLEKIKIVESGYENNPGVMVGEVEGKNILLKSSLFRDSCYFKITKAQANKLIKFLNNFIGEKNE